MRWFTFQKTNYVSQNWETQYVTAPLNALCGELKTSFVGLSESEARRRQKIYGPNEAVIKNEFEAAIDLAKRTVNPLVLLLFVVALLSFFFGDRLSAVIVSLMIATSMALSFLQERRALKSADKLRALITTTVAVMRDGKIQEKSFRELVPGDIVSLSAGDMVLADLRLINAEGLTVDQSSLTGESMPVEKNAELVPGSGDETPSAPNMLFSGSSIASGIGQGVVVHTGKHTNFGKLLIRLFEYRPETVFDKEIKDYTWLMIQAIVVIVTLILVIYSLQHRNFYTSLLYALAVAVQITPETLPMIVTLNLAKGAYNMAKKKVIIKHLNSIQNFGAMDMLCTDKTGTLTLNEVVLEHHTNPMGEEDEAVLELGYVNSYYQTGLKNLLDRAVLKHKKIAHHQYKKLGEIPFDFSRRIMSVIVKPDDSPLLIAKGSPEEIFKRCRYYENGVETVPLAKSIVPKLKQVYEDLGTQGFRVLAIGYKKIEPQKAYHAEDETDLILKGYLAFLDPPKPTAKDTIQALADKGVRLKILTGDNEIVTKKICLDVGFDLEKKPIITGDQVEKMSDTELSDVAERTLVFARVSPLQKERIILNLRKQGHIVGYLGDGINDALSLKAADVGISVNNAVDVAKESASIILLEKSLSVIIDGILEGRRVFTNFLKYLKMTGIVNVSYMLSITGASIFLPILPMASLQIILNNYLYEITQVGIPTDAVDESDLQKPKKWSIRHLFKFIAVMGPISSLFDWITFGILAFVFAGLANPRLFQTGWFIESMLAETLVIYAIRTEKIPVFQSHASRPLITLTLIVLSIVFILPFTFLGAYFHLVPMPVSYFYFLPIILLPYLFIVWLAKNMFEKKFGDI